MLRGLAFCLTLMLAALIILPFVASSIYIDRRGIVIPGHVYSKSEDVMVRYSDLSRRAQITVEYWKPDGTGVSFLNASLALDDYDAIHVNQPVTLHYLRAEDLPDLPLSKFLRGAQLLPTARLASQSTFSILSAQFTKRAGEVAAAIAGAVILLLIWRIARAPGFSWAVAGCILLGLAALLIADFPRPTPAPTIAVRQGVGRVKSVHRFTRLLAGSRSKGVIADQPIEVVGVEFIPENRTDPVLAIDLIDAGSLPGLKEKSSVSLDYEGPSPRTAYIRGATRNFVSRNLAGIGAQGIACLVVLIGFFAVSQILGRLYRRLTRTR